MSKVDVPQSLSLLETANIELRTALAVPLALIDGAKTTNVFLFVSF